MIKKLSAIFGVIIALSAVFGIVVSTDNRYALRAEHIQLAMEVNLDRLEREEEYVEKRIWSLEERYGGDTVPAEMREVINDLKIRLNKIRRKLEFLYSDKT